MLTFKNQIAADIFSTFLNLREFADTHVIDGREMTVVLDENELLERDKSKMGISSPGTYRSRRLIFVTKNDLGGRPALGRQMTLDGKLFRVSDCTEEAGILAIELEAVKS